MIYDLDRYKQKLEDACGRLLGFNLNHLDHDVKVLKQAFVLAYDEGLFDLHFYDACLQDELKLELFRYITPLSGSLAFLAIQILAANRIMQSNGFALAQSYYEKECGIIINHLRASKTVVSAIKKGESYFLSGKLTWASGYKIFDHLVVGFHYDGQEYQAIMPFKEQDGCHIDAVDDTFVGRSMNTVSMTLDQFEIDEKLIISHHPIGSYTQQKSISKTVHCALYGIGVGALQVIEDRELKEQGTKQLEVIKENFMSSSNPSEMDTLRVELFNFVQGLISTSMTIVGGKSMLTTQRLQQYYRELIMFNSNGLNQELKDLFKSSFLQRL